MAITDEEIKAHTNAAELDRAIQEALDMLRKIEHEKADFLVLYEQHKSRMLSGITQMTALRTALKIQTGI